MKKCQANPDTFQKKFYMFCQYSCKQGIVPVNLKIIKKKSFLITSLPVAFIFFFFCFFWPRIEGNEKKNIFSAARCRRSSYIEANKLQGPIFAKTVLKNIVLGIYQSLLIVEIGNIHFWVLINALNNVNLSLGLQISTNIDSSSNGPCIIKLFQVISLDLIICFINLKSKIAMISKSIFVDWKNLSDQLMLFRKDLILR